MHPIIDNNLQRLRSICEKYNVLSLSVFGSATEKERFTDLSDVDIYIDLDDEKLSLEEYAESYFNITYALEDLLKRKIDLITRRSIKNPYFKEEIDSTKVEIFSR